MHGVEPFAPEKKDQDSGAGNDTSNSVDSTYCNECDKQIGNRTAFSRHMLKVHENSRPYHCFKCGTKFTQVSSLNRHKLSCENPRRLSCHICGLVFNRADTLNDHLKHKHKPLSFYESQAKASETPGLELDAQCDGITGLSLSAVTIHKTPTPYPCSKCNKSFKALSSLNRHKLSCDNNLVVVCHICGRGFHRKDYLEAHLKGQHKRSKIDNYYCNQCGEAFQFKSLMIAHKGKCQDFFSVNQTYKQEEIKKAQPEEVNDSVITKNAYQSEGTSCTYCSTCEMQFSNCTAYGQHMRCVHNVARPYTCSNCAKCFMQMSSLTRHKVGCENRRVVFCHVCGRGFHRKDYLNDHLKGKHKRNSHLSYFCCNCGKGFQYKSWLFTHKAKCEYVASTSQTSEKEEAFHDPQNLDSTPIMK